MSSHIVLVLGTGFRDSQQNGPERMSEQVCVLESYFLPTLYVVFMLNITAQK